ncbi:MAG: VanW family protein [Polyangiaceae bacterium]
MSNTPEPNESAEPVPASGRVQRALGYLRQNALVLGLILPPSCTAGSYVSDELLTTRMPRGLRVAGVELSQLEAPAARQRLEQVARERLGRPLTLSLEQGRVQMLPLEAGLSIDCEKTLETAIAARRGRGFAVRFAGWLRSFWGSPTNSAGVVAVDRERLTQRLDALEAAHLSRPFSGGFHLDGRRIVPEYPRSGRVIDRQGALASLQDAVAWGKSELALPVKDVTVAVDRASIDRLVDRARAMSGSDVSLNLSEVSHTLTLRSEELVKALRVNTAAGAAEELVFDGESLLQGLGDRRAALENPAKSARFVVRPDDRVEIEPSQVERRLGAATLAAAVERAARGTERRAELGLELGAEPELTTAQAEALSIRGRVSSFTTRHPCCERRVDNIHRIADLLDGLLVKPGETVSVNAVVGPRTAKNGFVPAPTIEEGEMVETIGGGISQFATTFFNALFYGGYDIIERQPHTYWFTRYPMGHEATLSFPKPDLIFRNDTQAGMLIHTAYSKTSISVIIFGDNGGRRVQAEVSGRQNIVKPPLEILPNPAVSPQKEHTLQGGMIGWTVTVGRIIQFPDGTKKEERRKVTYKPKARRIEVHPCRVPEGEKGYTGEKCPAPEDSGEASEEASG